MILNIKINKMSFASYKARRISEIKTSHPHILSHRERMDIIMSEWQLELKKSIKIDKKDKDNVPSRHNKLWSKLEEDQLIDEIIMGKEHDEIATIHQRTITSIKGRLYTIALKLLKHNKTTVSDIVNIFDIDYNILSMLVNKSSSKLNR
jgi:hypothetical protein